MPSETPARYEEWLEFFFGRFERDSSDPWAMNWWFDASPPDMAELFIRTLQHSGANLARYSDAQVSTGLQALLFSNFSDVAYVLTNSSLSEQQRLDMLRSFRPLYRDCLAQRAPPVLGHLSETRDSPLEFVTYMLWDVAPFDVMALKSKERTDVLLDVFWDVLHLPNEACAESVLHGLGHLGEPARPRAREMIARWIDERPKVRPELLRYAAAAQTGCIL
jgi:hypothetical protein